MKKLLLMLIPVFLFGCVSPSPSPVELPPLPPGAGPAPTAARPAAALLPPLSRVVLNWSTNWQVRLQASDNLQDWHDLNTGSPPLALVSDAPQMFFRAQGQPKVTLAWDASVTSNVTYRIHYGTAPGVYDFSQDAGMGKSLQLGPFVPGSHWYFAATSVMDSRESTYSNEVQWTAPSNALQLTIQIQP